MLNQNHDRTRPTWWLFSCIVPVIQMGFLKKQEFIAPSTLILSDRDIFILQLNYQVELCTALQWRHLNLHQNLLIRSQITPYL